eukprot:4531785-Prorocentrum_lima.AAC.1
MIAAEVEAQPGIPPPAPLFLASACDGDPEPNTDPKVAVAKQSLIDHTLQHSAVPLDLYMARKGELERGRGA